MIRRDIRTLVRQHLASSLRVRAGRRRRAISMPAADMRATQPSWASGHDGAPCCEGAVRNGELTCHAGACVSSTSRSGSSAAHDAGSRPQLGVEHRERCGSGRGSSGSSSRGLPGFMGLYQNFPRSPYYASPRTSHGGQSVDAGGRFYVGGENICQDMALPASDWSSDISNVTEFTDPLHQVMIRMNGDPTAAWNSPEPDRIDRYRRRGRRGDRSGQRRGHDGLPLRSGELRHDLPSGRVRPVERRLSDPE